MPEKNKVIFYKTFLDCSVVIVLATWSQGVGPNLTLTERQNNDQQGAIKTTIATNWLLSSHPLLNAQNVNLMAKMSSCVERKKITYQ